MKAYTDRLIITNIESLKVEGGTYGINQGRNFKKATVVSAGKSPNGDSNTDLEGKEILFFDSVIPEKLPVGKEQFLMKRTNIEVIIN